MATSELISPPAVSPEASRQSGPTDRTLGTLLLLFFLALYLITSGGHGYSPDGDFAYRMARSLLVDPEHEYLKTMRSRLSYWGVGVSVVAQPLVLVGEPLSGLMPQKDVVDVDGKSYHLGYYRVPGYPDSGPTVGPAGSESPNSYLRMDLPDRPVTSLAIISFLAEARQIPQGTTVAEIEVADASGSSTVFPLRAGVETAEWSLGRDDGGAQHGMARVASVWSGNPAGRNYYVDLPFGSALQPAQLRVHYLLPEGRLYVRSMAFSNRQTGEFLVMPSEQATWSERENADLFGRLFFSAYNAILTALGCLLLFALARLLGYGQAVSVAATLLYGLATLAWPYSKYDFSEPTLVLFSLSALYLILRWGQERRDRFLLLAGVATLAMAGTKYASWPLVPLLLLQIVLIHWESHPSVRALWGAVRPVLTFCAPFLALITPAVWYLSRQFGYWPIILEAWDGVQRGWLPLPMLIGLRGLLLSPGRSFFLYSPPTILALVSVVPFVRRHGVRAFALLAITLVYFSPAYTMKVAWHAGGGWGPRYQVLVIPLVVLMIAPLIRKAIEERHRWARYALLATFLLGVGLQLLAVSKSFEQYLGIFRFQVVSKLPDQGARYGGADYYPYAVGLDDGNTLTATVWAWPFSPILAEGWLLSADVLSAGPPALQQARDRVLTSPPWLLWGIKILPEHPEYGLGLDYWSVRLKTDFPAQPVLLAGAFLFLLLLEGLLLTTGARLVSFLFGRSVRHRRAVRTWLAAATLAAVLFDGIHMLF